MQWAKNKKGFTIVELLIVIVVIAILAAITIVAYNGIQNRAKVTEVQSAVSQASRKVMAYSVSNNDEYPATLADAGVVNSGNIKYQYTYDNSATPRVYVLTATVGDISYNTSAKNPALQSGIGPGHNLVVWDDTDASSPLPFTSATDSTAVSIDTGTFRTGPSSLRIPSSNSNVPVRGNPFSGSVGQVYTVSFWLKTDPGWTGSNTNSKVRFGKADNSYITACTYDGVKTTWTFVTCNLRLTSTYTSITIRLGNDASYGAIWIDDFSVTRSE
jgi:prepilin-type N-terminal cleavage/methylation domain-containing protein